jgi:putative hemolysin
MSWSDLTILVTVSSAIVGCYCAACSYALIGFSRTRLSLWLEAHGRPNDVPQLVEMRDGLLMMTALIRTVANLVILMSMIRLLAPPGEQHSWVEMAKAIGAAAAIIAVFGVAMPLSISRYAAEPLLARSIPLFRLLTLLIWPVLGFCLHWLDPFVRRLLGAPKRADDDRAIQEQDILDAVTDGTESGLVDDDQKEMIQAVVEFPTTTVEQIMTPRTDVEGLPVDSSLEDIKAFVAEAGHSRVPVFEGDLDHIVGVLYVKDMIRLLGTSASDAFDVRSIVREAVFVPESKQMRELLNQFRSSKVHLAIVLDEYGGTAGLVTIEDALEEIVGEIQDEYEPVAEEPGIDKISEDTFVIHGRVHIDDVNDELGIRLPEDEDYETIAGFVMAQLGRVPTINEKFEYEGVCVTITDAERTKVNEVKIEVQGRNTARQSGDAA